MSKLLTTLLAAVFAAVTVTPVAFAQDKKDAKTEKKAEAKKDEKKAEAKKVEKKAEAKKVEKKKAAPEK